MKKTPEQRKQEKERLDLLLAYRHIFTLPQGEKVLNDLLKRHLFRSSMDATNPHMTSFNEGERNVVLSVMKMLNIEENHIRERLQNVNAP